MTKMYILTKLLSCNNLCGIYYVFKKELRYVIIIKYKKNTRDKNY